MNMSQAMRDIQLDTTLLAETANHLNLFQRELIKNIIQNKLLETRKQLEIEDWIINALGTSIGKSLAMIIDPETKKTHAKHIAQSLKPGQGTRKNMAKIDEITAKLPYKSLIQFHREALNQDLEKTIEKWHDMLPKQLKQAIVYGITRGEKPPEETEEKKGAHVF